MVWGLNLFTQQLFVYCVCLGMYAVGGIQPSEQTDVMLCRIFTSKSFCLILSLYFSCVLDIWLGSVRPICRASSSSSSMPFLSPAWHRSYITNVERTVPSGQGCEQGLSRATATPLQDAAPSTNSFEASRSPGLSSLAAFLTCRRCLHVLPFKGKCRYVASAVRRCLSS